MSSQEEFTFGDFKEADDQLRSLQQSVRFNTTDFPVSVHYENLKKGLYYIPSYQRDHTWDKRRQGRFIESLLLGLPIPYLFGVFDEEQEGKTCIIDGVQRLSTLRSFIDGELKLIGLNKLTMFIGAKVGDLSTIQRRKLDGRILRMVVLEGVEPSVQFDMFERINTTPLAPTRAEIRRGAFPGPMMDLITKCAVDHEFALLTPMGKAKVATREREELIARLFCYTQRYRDFRHDVGAFIDQFVRETNTAAKENPETLEEFKKCFEDVKHFAAKFYPHGFARPGHRMTPRVRFEALGVGAALALQCNPSLSPSTASLDWIGNVRSEKGKSFFKLIRTDASNSRTKLEDRILFVRNQLLGEDND